MADLPKLILYKGPNDLTNKQFGLWKVLGYVGNRKWLCECLCGTVKSVNGRNLVNGLSESCGHTKRDDLTDKQFGFWRVLKYSGNLRWSCRCVCGTERDVLTQALISGRSKSCGCGGIDISENYRSKMMNKFGDVSSTRQDNPRELWQIQVLSNGELFKNYLMRHKYKPKIIDLVQELDTTFSTIAKSIHKYNLEDYVDLYSEVSAKELELLHYIKSIYPGKIVTNSRSVIYPYELDIYLPDLKLAIEFNGTYWHSDLHKEKYYHYNKSKLCSESGINLIHIFEYEWNMDKDDIQNYLDYVINSKKTKASNLRIIKISGDSYKIVNLSISNISNLEDTFRDIVDKFNPSSITIECDMSKGYTSIITQLGFHLSHITEPNCLLVDGDNRLMVDCNNLNSNRYYKIYDCGSAIYTWRNKEVAV